MSETKFKCKKCGSEYYKLKEVDNGSGVATGLYCADCETWHKWINKKEIESLKEDAKQYEKIFKLPPKLPDFEPTPMGQNVEELDEQIKQLTVVVAALKDLRDRLKAVKGDKNISPRQEEDDMPPWD